MTEMMAQIVVCWADMHGDKDKSKNNSPNPSFLRSGTGCRTQEVLKNSGCKNSNQPNLSLEVVLSRPAGCKRRWAWHKYEESTCTTVTRSCKYYSNTYEYLSFSCCQEVFFCHCNFTGRIIFLPIA